MSRVRTPPERSLRPEGYPKVSDDSDDGYLVVVDVVHDDLDLGQPVYRELVPHAPGTAGPLDKNGVAKQAYLSPVDAAVARQLLERAGVWIAEEAQSMALPYGSAEPTDAAGMATLRREQGELRECLLGRQIIGTCAICGRSLPADLLVAAHIQRRSSLTDAERRDFGNVAMLACLLGCDALFEAGYVIVDGAGVVRSGRAAPTPGLAAQTEALAGRHCSAHRSETAGYFARRSSKVSAAI